MNFIYSLTSFDNNLQLVTTCLSNIFNEQIYSGEHYTFQWPISIN